MGKNKRFEMKVGIRQFVDNQTNKTYCEYNLDDVVELLNTLHEENIALKRTDNICDLETQIMQLREELDYYKSKCASLETGLIQVERTNLKLQEENQQYKQLIKKVLETTPIEHSLAIELKNSVRELYA